MVGGGVLVGQIGKSIQRGLIPFCVKNIMYHQIPIAITMEERRF